MGHDKPHFISGPRLLKSEVSSSPQPGEKGFQSEAQKRIQELMQRVSQKNQETVEAYRKVASMQGSL